jgi:hypothetical protein
MRAIYFMGAFIVMGTLAAFAARYLFAPSAQVAGQGTDEFLSGPPVGSKVPGPFEPLNINGEKAGEESCLYCRFGTRPVAMIFATKPTDTIAALLQPIEKGAVETSKTKEVGACLVITNSNEDIKNALNKLADKENYKQVVLAMIETAGVKRYQLHPDAEVTVLLYSKGVVRVNHAYKAGGFTDKVAKEVGLAAANFLAADGGESRAEGTEEHSSPRPVHR